MLRTLVRTGILRPIILVQKSVYLSGVLCPQFNQRYIKLPSREYSHWFNFSVLSKGSLAPSFFISCENKQPLYTPYFHLIRQPVPLKGGSRSQNGTISPIWRGKSPFKDRTPKSGAVNGAITRFLLSPLSCLFDWHY